MNRTRILGIEVDKVTRDEALARCLAFLAAEPPRTHLVVTPNAEIAWKAETDPELATVINHADLVIADGVGIVYAAKILGDPVPEKVAGVELATRLVARLSDERRGRIFLLGAKPEVVAEAARRLQATYPGITIAGYHHGYFGPGEDEAVLAAIAESRANLLFAGMGAPRQEKWLYRYRDRLGVRLALGVGGTLDVWAGAVERPPEWAVRANLEWAYRIIALGRFRRSLPPLIRFGLTVLWRRLGGG
jgi:N-acetylglucosaminyldiphosphoundecaprenol N-acetyl-beta-D-mannosaminyltransferase